MLFRSMCLQRTETVDSRVEKLESIFFSDLAKLFCHESVCANHIHVRRVGTERVDVGPVAGFDLPGWFSGQDGGKEVSLNPEKRKTGEIGALREKPLALFASPEKPVRKNCNRFERIDLAAFLARP